LVRNLNAGTVADVWRYADAAVVGSGIVAEIERGAQARLFRGESIRGDAESIKPAECDMGIGICHPVLAVVAGFLISVYSCSHLWEGDLMAAAFLKKSARRSCGAFALPLVDGPSSVSQPLFPVGCFQSNLGFFPPRDVVELHGRQLIIGDSGEAYLRFRAMQGKPFRESLATGF